MNIPEGFVLVPVEPIKAIDMGWAYLDAAREAEPNKIHSFSHAGYRAMVAAAPPVELPVYNEAKELADCRAHWEKNPNCLFSDMWLGWKACAQSRDGSVSDE